MSLCLLTRCLHQAEGIEVRESLLVVAMHMDLRIGCFADEFLRPDHHGSFHARVCNVGYHVQDDQGLLEFNDLLISLV